MGRQSFHPTFPLSENTDHICSLSTVIGLCSQSLTPARPLGCESLAVSFTDLSLLYCHGLSSGGDLFIYAGQEVLRDA